MKFAGRLDLELIEILRDIFLISSWLYLVVRCIFLQGMCLSIYMNQNYIYTQVVDLLNIIAQQCYNQQQEMSNVSWRWTHSSSNNRSFRIC